MYLIYIYIYRVSQNELSIVILSRMSPANLQSASHHFFFRILTKNIRLHVFRFVQNTARNAALTNMCFCSAKNDFHPRKWSSNWCARILKFLLETACSESLCSVRFDSLRTTLTHKFFDSMIVTVCSLGWWVRQHWRSSKDHVKLRLEGPREGLICRYAVINWPRFWYIIYLQLILPTI